MKVQDILAKKGRIVHTVNPDFTVYQCLKLMDEKNIGAVVVIENDSITGLFSERDYARKVVLKGKSSKETLVNEVMAASPILTVTEDEDIRQCMNIMTNQFVRHLPVLKDNRLTGIISIGDVVRNIIDEQEFIIDNLGNYISGRKS